MIQEEKHLDIREKLLSLPKVKASENFESKLLSKINLEEAQANNNTSKPQTLENPNKGFFGNLFGQKNPFVIAGVSFAIVAIILIGIYFVNTSETDLTKIETTSIPETDVIEELKSAEDTKSEQLTDAEIMRESKEVASNDVGNVTTPGNRNQSSNEFMGRGYTDSYNYSDSPSIELSTPEAESDNQRGISPTVKPRERTDSRTALPPRISAMPNGNNRVHQEESVSSTKDSQMKRGNIREINVIEKNDLENLREKIINLDN